jgi:signal transduction histidine kinase
MLDVARLQNGKLPLELSACNLHDLVTRAIDDVDAALSEHQLDLRLADESLLVAADEQRLRQALSNLLLNAAMYSPVETPICVELVRAGETARIVVTDQGIGIPAAALPHIFSRFYRAPNVDAIHGVSGMGVGLYLAAEILARHGGRVFASSEQGRGSVFTIELPLLGDSSPPALGPPAAGS